MGCSPFLTTGNIVFSLEDLPTPIPSFLSFLFEDSDFYKVEETEEDGEGNIIDTYLTQIGFKCTAEKCREAFDSYGYDIPFFIEIYKFFRKDLQNNLLSYLEDELLPQKKKRGVLKNLQDKIDALSPEKEIETFIDFMKISAETAFSIGVFEESINMVKNSKYFKGKSHFVRGSDYIRVDHLRYDFISGDYTKHYLIDFESLQSFLIEKCIGVSLSINLVMTLFYERYLIDYPEVIFLMYLRLMTEIIPKDAIVDLNLGDAYFQSDERSDIDVKDVKWVSCFTLLDKANLYNRVFRIIFENRQDLWEINAKNSSNLIVNQLHENRLDTYTKGRLLEDLVEILFGNHRMFRVVEKRYNTGDEEIDLIIQNNVHEPFWIALHSPLLLFECKNWSRQIGTKELRDFEGKLRNHSNMARIGVFFSYNGFSSECIDELKRMGRGDQVIVLCSKEDITAYIKSTQTLVEWLENLILKLR
jgi:hypothetical protein